MAEKKASSAKSPGARSKKAAAAKKARQQRPGGDEHDGAGAQARVQERGGLDAEVLLLGLLG